MAMNHILTYGERLPGYMYMSYLETKNVPKWAERITPDGKHDIDHEAYMKYFSEFVKHNPCTHFFVNSTEGSSVYDYPDLTVKVAKAVKAIDPRLKIGAVANVSGGVEAVRKIRKDVLEAIDIFVDDIYNTEVDVLLFKRELERLGYKNKEIWLPEHGDLASRDQVSRAAVMVRNVTFALANGLDKLLWWSDPAPSYIMLDKNYQYTFGPDLRGSADYLIDKNFFAGWRTKGGGPRIAPARKHSEQAWSPFLEAVSLHHLMKHLGYVYDGRTLDIGCDITGLLYKNKLFPGKSGKEISILALSRIPGSGAIHKIMKVDSPYHLTDIYGQGKALNPKEGISLVTITEEPLLGAFNELQSKIQFAESPVKITLPQAIFPGSTVELKVILNNPFSVTCDEELKVFIDPRWAITPETQQVKLAVGAKGEYTFQIKAPQKIFAAQYPIFLRFSTSEGKIWGELEEKITVTDNLTMTMEAKPGRPGEKPDVQITLKNNSTRAEMAQVSLLTSLTTQLRPEKLVKSCELPAGKTGIVNFNLNRSPEVNSPYGLECSVSASGQTIKSAEKLFFIGVPKRKMPIKIDGDLGDWSANNPAILPFFCSYRIPDREASKNYHPDDPKNDWKGKQDSSAVFYMCWDENRIYWAMRITDDIKYN
ncbi:MAG: hypothetical protein WCP55_17745, partial [Lentisphaerota bacterium]